ncbi:hypothetical protein LUZ63_012460 [Rhynchospora breviuscula]|uniref:Uncharacterized protein n=1 Tax=Rhynchospora breviuscula TaxID=2022672 RepID=A0A9Q0CKQ0_9POAL|nr:hypothetical protein LUZ63_012460 [Rhynchospora breviuscula]
MDSIFKLPFAQCSNDPVVQEGIDKCPFLRNINEPTVFSFSSVSFPTPVRGAKGPIFEDEPNFDVAFRLFHGQNGVVPLAGRSFVFDESHVTEDTKTGRQFDPLAAKAATISLSAFGPCGPFAFDSLSKKLNMKRKMPSSYKPFSQHGGGHPLHESLSNEWLETGQCPIAKSYRAVSGVIPLVTKFIQPPPGLKVRCPQAVVAMRAALSRTEFVKTLRPQSLPAKMLAIALLGMAANIPLGVWREHTAKFSLQWFAAVHAAVPFIAMLRKSVLMPKVAMAITLGASILGQTIGSRAERIRLKALEAQKANPVMVETIVAKHDGGNELDFQTGANGMKMPHKLRNCGEVKVWEVIPMKIEGSTGTSMCC